MNLALNLFSAVYRPWPQKSLFPTEIISFLYCLILSDNHDTRQWFFRTWSSLIPQLSVSPFKFILQTQSPSAKYWCCKMGICSFLSALIDIKRLPSPPTLAVYYSTHRLSQWRRRKQSKPFVPLSLSIAGWNTSRSPSALRVLMCRFYLKLSQGIWLKKTENNLNVLTQSHSR